MKNLGKTNWRRAFMDAEIVVAVVVLMLLAVLTAEAIFSYRRTRDELAWRQAAAWAADAQLKRYHAGVALNTPPPSGVLAEDIRLETSVEPGRGTWEGFRRVTVTALVALPTGRTVREQVSGYIGAEVTR